MQAIAYRCVVGIDDAAVAHVGHAPNANGLNRTAPDYRAALLRALGTMTVNSVNHYLQCVPVLLRGLGRLLLLGEGELRDNA